MKTRRAFLSLVTTPLPVVAEKPVGKTATSGRTSRDDRSIARGAPPPTAALLGDSLTSLSYGPLHPYIWSIGIAGGVLKTVANCGVANDTIKGALARIHSNHTEARPGLAGLADLGWVLLRIGTNNFRMGATINTTHQADYVALIEACLGYAQRVIVFAIPPVYTRGDARGAGIPGANAWIASYCAGNPRLHFIDDCVHVRADGNWALDAYASDGVHFSSRASYQLGIDGGDALRALLAPYGYSSPLSADPNDRYPTTPQWVQNHVLSGTAGRNSIGVGLVPTYWSLGRGGAKHGANSSIVPPDSKDPIQVPWLRIVPTELGSSGWIGLGCRLAHASITEDEPEGLDVVAQVRFNAFDVSRFQSLQMFVYGKSNERLSPAMFLRMGGPERLTRTVVMRQAVPRSTTRRAHQGATLVWRLSPREAYVGDMGTLDIRCLTVRA